MTFNLEKCKSARRFEELKLTQFFLKFRATIKYLTNFRLTNLNCKSKFYARAILNLLEKTHHPGF